MIVLDEQLLGRHLEREIRQWYRGTVRFIIELRPNTVIRDEAIPALLRQQNQPTFVTINEKDFWRKVAIDDHYGVVCFAWPDSRVRDIPRALRVLFRHPQCKTKAKRMGKVIRVGHQEISYYTYSDHEVQRLL